MNKFNILTAFYLFFSYRVIWAETTLEELTAPELNPILALKNEIAIHQEFKTIHAQLKTVLTTPSSCPKKILDDLKRLSANRGLLDSVHFYLGICKDLEGESKAAIEEYEKSLKLKRSNKEAILRLAYLNAVIKDYARTISLSEEVLWLGYKSKVVPLYLIAVAQKQLGNIKEAQASLDKLDALDSKFPPSLVLRKNLLLKEISQTSDPNKVKLLRDSYNKLLPRLISLDPENKTYTLEHAKILLTGGHPVHSPQTLNQGLALTRKFSRPNDKNDKIDEAFLLLELQFLEKQGKSSEALGILNKLSEAKSLGPNLEYRKQEIFNKLHPELSTD